MSTRAATRMTLEVNVMSEGSDMDALEQAVRIKSAIVEAIRTAKDPGLPADKAMQVHFSAARVEVNSVSAMHMGTGDMDK